MCVDHMFLDTYQAFALAANVYWVLSSEDLNSGILSII